MKSIEEAVKNLWKIISWMYKTEQNVWIRQLCKYFTDLSLSLDIKMKEALELLRGYGRRISHIRKSLSLLYLNRYAEPKLILAENCKKGEQRKKDRNVEFISALVLGQKEPTRLDRSTKTEWIVFVCGTDDAYFQRAPACSINLHLNQAKRHCLKISSFFGKFCSITFTLGLRNCAPYPSA